VTLVIEKVLRKEKDDTWKGKLRNIFYLNVPIAVFFMTFSELTLLTLV